MKAITVKQPWAQLICEGIKDIENRTWKTNFRGRVLIHAAATDFDFRNHMTSEYQRHYIRNVKKPYVHGAIIGSVEIIDCVKSKDDSFSSWGDFYCWHWKLKNPILFKKPIENVKGKLSFWESGHEVCNICGYPADLICAICGEYFCPGCSANHNQFTQIDYDCCKRCEDAMKER
jgi:hypothetical protein